MLKQLAFRTGLVAAAWACAALAHAASVNVEFENFTYSGSVTRYATLTDAQNQTNATGGPYTILTVSNGPRTTRPDARDGALIVTSAAPPAYGSDFTQFLTSWYFTTVPANGDGWGNPQNTNDGFFQYYLESSPTVTGGWQPGYTQFQLTLSGGNGDSYDDARFWPAPDGGASAISYGEFIEFNLNVSATFASPATLNGTTNWYETNEMPTSMTGTVTGIFHNDQLADPTYNGYYRFDYTTTGPGSWAADNGATWNAGGGIDYPPASFWAAPAVAPSPIMVPGPGKLALFGLALALGLMGASRQWRS